MLENSFAAPAQHAGSVGLEFRLAETEYRTVATCIQGPAKSWDNSRCKSRVELQTPQLHVQISATKMQGPCGPSLSSSRSLLPVARMLYLRGELPVLGL